MTGTLRRPPSPSRPRACWRLTAPRAVILELARESRGTKPTALGHVRINEGVGNPDLVLLCSCPAPSGGPNDSGVGSREDSGLRRPAPSFSSLLGNPEDERYSLSQAWVKNGDKATRPVAHYPVTVR